MNLSKHDELKELLKTFAIMNKDGILSTDDEPTTEDDLADEDEGDEQRHDGGVGQRIEQKDGQKDGHRYDGGAGQRIEQKDGQKDVPRNGPRDGQKDIIGSDEQRDERVGQKNEQKDGQRDVPRYDGGAGQIIEQKGGQRDGQRDVPRYYGGAGPRDGPRDGHRNLIGSDQQRDGRAGREYEIGSNESRDGRRDRIGSDELGSDEQRIKTPSCEKSQLYSSHFNGSHKTSREPSSVSYSVPSILIPVPHKPNAYFDSYCDQYLRFTDQNPTTYHVVDHFKSLLENNGFTYWPESESFDSESFKHGGLFFTTRGGTSLVAFAIGGQWKPTNGIGAIGSHVDALSVQLKPSSIKHDIDGYQMLGVANYSGTLNKLWCDRDLGIGGSVIVRDEATGRKWRKIISSSPHPIAKIPTLAEHFGSVAEKVYNKETEMVPIVGYSSSDNESPPSEKEKSAPLYGRHPLALLRYVAQLAHVPLQNILQLDLQLFDVQKATRGGLGDEFIYAPRIDDRLCSFSAIYALIEWSQSFYSNPNTDDDHPFKEYGGFNAVLLADNEEIGSATRTGAKGKLLNSVVDRVVSVHNKLHQSRTLASVVFANSILLSADVTHALNPNFVEAYLENHHPKPNVGLTVKLDANGHVMTDAVGWSLLKEVADRNHLTLQQFHVKNDAPSGGTIGPMLATDTGSRVIDVGLPQLAMHSIRGAAGFKEAGLGVKIFKSFFKDWRNVYDKYGDL